MEKAFRVLVFGKVGCTKCTMLKKRLHTLLDKGEWQDFEQGYRDVETPDGLVDFCRAECINPNRIPALVVTRKDETTGQYRKLRNPSPGKPDKVCKTSKLYTYLGLQTDYGDVGRGTITPKMLTSVLAEARQAS